MIVVAFCIPTLTWCSNHCGLMRLPTVLHDTYCGPAKCDGVYVWMRILVCGMWNDCLVSAYCICRLSVVGVGLHWQRVTENILKTSCLECVSTTLYRGRPWMFLHAKMTVEAVWICFVELRSGWRTGDMGLEPSRGTASKCLAITTLKTGGWMLVVYCKSRTHIQGVWELNIDASWPWERESDSGMWLAVWAWS